ncbi:MULTISPECIES: insulinase family protein [unclassified Curtobacterium]|uniref:insulinase family protein n=1 Tax=unclassified Curtobacterium TaxID=257496 RepID=UPI00226B79E8|nr:MULTISPECIES: insulinase family protein [unclassified Curtobacterium]
MRHFDVLEQKRPVSVLHEPADGVVVARLAFGVGSCDEPVTVAGITHLVEHLAVRGALPIALPHNATTADHVTVFEVQATTTDQAMTALQRLADSIGGLLEVSDDDVTHERKILAGEDRLRYHEQVASVHTVRFGPAGLGRAGAGSAAVAATTAAELRRWVAERFVAENAVVTVAGGRAPASAIDLRLPSGEPAGPVGNGTGSTRDRVLAASQLSGIAASVVVAAPVARLLEAVVEHELFASLRITAGLAYAVEAHTLDVDRETAVVAVVAETESDDAARATDLVIETLHRVAAQGPSDQTIAAIDAARALNHLDQAARADALIWASMTERLRGVGRPVRFDTAVSTVEVDELRAALTPALSTLVVCVDEDAEVDLPTLAQRHGLSHRSSEPGRPLQQGVRLPKRSRNSYRDAFLPGWASVHVEIHGHELVIKPRGSEARILDLREAAVVGTRGDGGVTVVDADGNAFHVRADEWWRGPRFVKSVIAATPAHLIRRFAD